MSSDETGPLAHDETTRSRMEALIAVMRRPAAAPASATAPASEPAPTTDDDDRLAAAAWQAMQRGAAAAGDDTVDVPLAEGASTAGHGAELGGWRRERAAIELGARLGRYMPIEELGRGGMGRVLRAYDPKLQREVALKLLNPEVVDVLGRARMVREARSMARLRHPNVVAVYDVDDDPRHGVVLAMELVEGQTLREWLRERPRAWPEVLHMFLEAGRGLSAAHRQGLLHRDFKPANVLVGHDGRVEVSDFGLAKRSRDEGEPITGRVSPSGVVARADEAETLTEDGEVMGTPLYMAPEQHRGEPLTSAADQYAFCVALWEALHGERPFEGHTPAEQLQSAREGRLRAPPKSSTVPRWLRRACERGLAVDPTLRWPSMDALLGALAKGRARARVRRGLVAVGMLALLGGGVEAYRRYEVAQTYAACEASGDEVLSAWSPARAQALRDALMATGVSYATTTADKVTPWLDRQAAAWREARVDACLDVEVRARWDASMLDRSRWCLDERRTELESLVNELLTADANVVQKAVMAASGLASVEPCRDEHVLDALGLPSLEQREAIREVRAEVARAGSLERTGRYDKGLAVAREALAEAEALEWPPLVAVARLKVGSLLKETGAYDDAERTMEAAYFEAGASSAAEVAVDAATKLAYVVGVKLARYADGLRWVRHAEVALVDVRDDERLRRADLLSRLAVIHMLMGDFEQAKGFYEQDLAITEEVLGRDHPSMVASLNNLANLHRDVGAYDEAIAAHERALAIVREVLGPDHPRVAAVLGNLANVHWEAGRLDEAKALYERSIAVYEVALRPDHPDVAYSVMGLANVQMAEDDPAAARVLYERALAIFEQSFGPDHPEVAMCLFNLANLHEATGDHDEARVLYERALAIFEESLGPEHPKVAMCLTGLATVRMAQGAPAAARGLHERALAIFEESLGPEHPNVALTLNNLASVEQDLGAYEDAKAGYERALAIGQKALGPEHPHMASPLLGLAQIAIAQQRPADAVRLARQAVAIREKHGIEGEPLADVRFVLAEGLWDAPVAEGRDRTGAVQLATRARDAYRDAGAAEELAEVEAWLGAR